MDSWFHKLIRAEAEKLGGASALAKRLGLRKSVISDWMAGGKADTMERLEKYLAAMGGDISRALPSWKPPAPASAEVLEENQRLRSRITELEGCLRGIAAVSSAQLNSEASFQEGGTGKPPARRSRKRSGKE